MGCPNWVPNIDSDRPSSLKNKSCLYINIRLIIGGFILSKIGNFNSRQSCGLWKSNMKNPMIFANQKYFRKSFCKILEVHVGVNIYQIWAFFFYLFELYCQQIFCWDPHINTWRSTVLCAWQGYLFRGYLIIHP